MPCNKFLVSSVCPVTFSGHKNHVMSIAWSPDAKCLVSGDKDGKVCCWDPITGNLQGNPLTVKLFFFLFYFITLVHFNVSFCTDMTLVSTFS